MTLAKRLTLRIVGLAICLAAMGGVTIWGLLSVLQATEVSRDEYFELRLVLDVDQHLHAAREALVSGQDHDLASQELAAALQRVNDFDDFQESQERDATRHEEDEDQLLSLIANDIRKASASLRAVRQTVPHDNAAALAAFNEAQSHIRQISAETDERISHAQEMSNRAIGTMLLLLGSASVIILVLTVVLNVAQYRSIMHPLRRLAAGVRRVATGRFDERVLDVPQGEFADVAADFNQMAARLHDLYSTLEARVREKSRELVRSERLASVGYLAAGVAHEINNPLGIITGYAEVTLKRLQRENGDVRGVNAEEALRIIRDEAFRCKETTEKLLVLASGREVPHERVKVEHIVDDVVSILGMLPQYRDRQLAIDIHSDDDLEILGNETELRQVILNLALNALEAVQPKVGRISFDGRRINGTVQLVVSDNGRGMTTETLEHIFEPFFTERADPARRGTGLGLSISFAIIEAHGGKIRAESKGPNQGSRFLIELPAASRQEVA